MPAFLSYQTKDRHAAASIQNFLTVLRIPSFMAHEDLEVSAQWQAEILRQLRECDLFIALLSKHYLASAFCMQEAGIAVYRAHLPRSKLTIIPLSLDGTVSPGFMLQTQSRRIDPDNIENNILFGGLAKYNPRVIIDYLIEQLSGSRSFRGAEYHFQRIIPLLNRASDDQKVRILEVSESNGQIWDAALCRIEYLPPLFATHGRFMRDQDARRKLRERLNSN